MSVGLELDHEKGFTGDLKGAKNIFNEDNFFQWNVTSNVYEKKFF